MSGDGCPKCGHRSKHDERWGCMAEAGEGGSGSVADIVFCKCRHSGTSVAPADREATP